MKKIVASLIVVASLVAAIWFAPPAWRARWRTVVGGLRTPAPGADGVPGDAPQETVTCWFPPRSGLEPVAEERRIPASATAQERLGRLVAELHRSPVSAGAEAALPSGLAPRAVFLAGDGTVYVDLPMTAFERPLGPRDELVLLRAIARTCLSNVPEARALVVLGEGAPRTSLFGHFPGGGRYVLPRLAPERGPRRGRAGPR